MLKSKQAFIEAYKKKTESGKPYVDEGDLWDDNDVFLDGQVMKDDLPDEDSDLFTPEAELESPLKKALRKRMNAK